MPYATWLPDILRDAGLTVRPYTGWASRGSSLFSPRGVMLHHTVTSPSTQDLLVDRMLAITGSSKVNPPLANYSTNRDGSVSVIAAGTANHGGTGTWNGVSGNRFWFGDEMKNLGTSAEPWQARQIESALRAAAAVLTHIGAGASWMCGHKEYATPPGRKVDPHSLNMNSLRTAVAELMEDDMSQHGPEKWDKADWQAYQARTQVAVLTAPIGRSPLNLAQHIQNTHSYAKQSWEKIKGIAPDGVDEVALVAAVVDAIEDDGIAQAVADEIDRRARERLS